jgi:hypothetical protein
MDWLYEHADVVTATATVGLLAVWIIYAQIFYKDHKRRIRPRIIIDQMSGPGTAAATCVLSNLSSEAIYLECVLAVVATEDGTCTAAITEQRPISSAKQQESQIVSLMRQGPLASGELISIGTIEELFNAAVGAGNSWPAPQLPQHLEVRIVATMSSEDNPIGAWKRFEISEDGQRSRPMSLGTHQMYTRRAKRRVLGWLNRS